MSEINLRQYNDYVILNANDNMLCNPSNNE